MCLLLIRKIAYKVHGGVKQREEGMEYHVPHQKGARVTWHAVNYETVRCATVLAREYLESVNGGTCDPDVGDVPEIEVDEDGLLE